MQTFNGRAAILDIRPIECTFTDACDEAAGVLLDQTGPISTAARTDQRPELSMLTKKKF